MTNASPNPSAPQRRVLTPDQLHRIHTAVRQAANTRQLLSTTLGALYGALDSGPAAVSGTFLPDRYAIPTSQWRVILAAITGRAETWGTAAEVGVELAMNLMPQHYDDPAVPAPDLQLPDYRPAEYRLTFTRDAVDVVAACEGHLARLRAFYGAASDVYQNAVHSWHRNLAALLTMNTGADSRIDKDGELSLIVHTRSGLVYALIFHGQARRCTTDGCDALVDDDGTPRPAQPGTHVVDHRHTPSYPVGAPSPGTWSLHS